MALRIDDTEMSSDVTRHTAAVLPGVTVEGGPTAWSVTWLPGRAFTRNQVITAMTIAEAVHAHAEDLLDNTSKWWNHVGQWAAELGITGPYAVAEASLSPEDFLDLDDAGDADEDAALAARAREMRAQAEDAGS